MKPDQPAKIIYTYTDHEALEDGCLVVVEGPQGLNRITRSVWDKYVQTIAEEEGMADLNAVITEMLKIKPSRGWRTGTIDGVQLWLIPNENDGLTLMFPSDY